MRTIATPAGAAYFGAPVGTEVTADVLRDGKRRNPGRTPPKGGTRSVTSARRGRLQMPVPAPPRVRQRSQLGEWQLPTLTGAGMILEIDGVRHELPGHDAVAVVWMSHGDAAWVLDRRSDQLRVMAVRYGRIVERRALQPSIAAEARSTHFNPDGLARYRTAPG